MARTAGDLMQCQIGKIYLAKHASPNRLETAVLLNQL